MIGRGFTANRIRGSVLPVRRTSEPDGVDGSRRKVWTRGDYSF